VATSVTGGGGEPIGLPAARPDRTCGMAASWSIIGRTSAVNRHEGTVGFNSLWGLRSRRPKTATRQGHRVDYAARDHPDANVGRDRVSVPMAKVPPRTAARGARRGGPVHSTADGGDVHDRHAARPAQPP